MCLAYPAQVVAVTGDGAVDMLVRGRLQRVVLVALDGDPPAAGDWLLVQSGLALDRLDPAEAAARSVLLDILTGGPDDH